MRLQATVLTLAVVSALLLVGPTSAASAKQEKCGSVKANILHFREKTWTWQQRLGAQKTRASLEGRQLEQYPGCAYLGWVSKLWQKRASSIRHRYITLNAPIHTLSTEQLYASAEWQIKHGAIYSHAYGAVSPRFREICYELVDRAFSPYGTSSWAKYIVGRESGCNPAAINFTYSDPGARATGLAQMIPNVHRWADYGRMMHDLRYSIQVFLRLSNGGRSTGPWSTY